MKPEASEPDMCAEAIAARLWEIHTPQRPCVRAKTRWVALEFKDTADGLRAFEERTTEKLRRANERLKAWRAARAAS